MNIPQANLNSKANQKITKNNIESYAHSLNEIKFVNGLSDISNVDDRKKIILRAINYLDVENSLRYQPRNGKTYCNIYAHDLLKLLNTYIPRVWWKADSLEKITSGDLLDAIYEKTVEELNSNKLYEWLNAYSSNFQWEEAKNFEILCRKIKTIGTIGIICGKRLKGKGHISMAYSQKELLKLEKVYFTDAGAICKKKYQDQWWDNNKYKVKFFYFKIS